MDAHLFVERSGAVEAGNNSISLNPDTLIQSSHSISETEKEFAKCLYVKNAHLRALLND